MRLTIDPTGKCNQACVFCYQDSRDSLSSSQIISFIDKYPSAKVIEIGGGEPFLFEGLEVLVKDIYSKGKACNLSTNAHDIPSWLLDLESNVRKNMSLQVSIHGSDREVYQKVHGKDHYDSAIKNTEMLKSLFSTSIVSVICRDNFDDVGNLADMSNSLSLPHRINPVLPVGRGKEVILSSSQMRLLRGKVFDLFTRGYLIDSSLLHENTCPVFDSVRSSSCSCEKAYLSPNGKEYRCEFLQGGKHD
jgi:MoaA/NifB/PqqE/SkfB family radical SAM enzyme